MDEMSQVKYMPIIGAHDARFKCQKGCSI